MEIAADSVVVLDDAGSRDLVSSVVTESARELATSESYLVIPGSAPVYLDPRTGAFLAPGHSREAVRAWIMDLAARMLALPDAHHDFPLKHTFLDGMYMRELFLPKGSLLIGKVHRLPCLNIVSSGNLAVLTELGSARLEAGYTAVSPAGIQKVGYAYEDTVFVNIFRTDETDINKIEQVIAFDNYTEAGFISLAGEEKLSCL